MRHGRPSTSNHRHVRNALRRVPVALALQSWGAACDTLAEQLPWTDTPECEGVLPSGRLPKFDCVLHAPQIA